MNDGEMMKTRIEKRGSDFEQSQPETEQQIRERVKNQPAALPKSHPTPYAIAGNEWLKVMDTFDIDPEFFKEFEALQEQMR